MSISIRDSNGIKELTLGSNAAFPQESSSKRRKMCPTLFSEHLRGEMLMTKHYTNLRLLPSWA